MELRVGAASKVATGFVIYPLPSSTRSVGHDHTVATSEHRLAKMESR